MKVVFLYSFICLYLNAFSCSCPRVYYCEAYHSTDKKISFRGVVFDSRLYTRNTNAVYVKLLNSYDDDFGMTDTIKLFGGPNEASCDFDVLRRFRIGDTIRAVITLDRKPTFDPPSGKENYYTNKLHLCGILYLQEKGDSIFGPIHLETRDSITRWIFSADIASFERKLVDCSFFVSTNVSDPTETFSIEPNPTYNSEVRVKSSSSKGKEVRIEVWSISGELIFQKNMKYNSRGEMVISNIPRGIYILREEHMSHYRTIKMISI